MTDDCNRDALLTARAIVAERYHARYHRNAIMAGAWDRGRLVQDALREVLTQPEIAGGDE